MDPSKHAPLRIVDIRSKYKVIDKVGKGTYGTVYKVLNLQDNKHYAIKKFQNTQAKLQVEGFPITALRQISLLKQLNHPNIVNLQEIICSKPNKRNLFRGSTFMVFEYMHHDFAGLFRSKVKFTTPQIKCIMKQLLQGCSFLHKNKVMHRDIKSANILMNDQGVVQLADFGLGRRTRFESIYTYKVVTLWYRAPELLLGCKTYNHKVDVWSLGCVFAQFLIGDVLFKKETQYAIIQKIYQICGDLDENQYTEEYLKGCVYYNDMRPKKSYKNTLTNYIKKLCPSVDSLTLQFLQGLLQLNPYKRLSCEQALAHEYFKQQPKPCKPEQIQKLDVQYHQMFRDRSLKIQRKQKKLSPDWSQEQERKKVKQVPRQQKSYKYDNRENKQWVRNERTNDRQNDRSKYNNKPYGYKYQENRDQRNIQRTNVSYKKEQPLFQNKRDDSKTYRRHSKSHSQSQSSSSSSSRSKRSRTRDYRKPRYQSRDDRRPYTKEPEKYERQNGQIGQIKINESRHSYPTDTGKDRYKQKDRIQYDNRKGYEKRTQSYNKDNQKYRQEQKKYRDKHYDYKERREPDYADRKYDSYKKDQKYRREEYSSNYNRYPPKEKYEDDNRHRSYTKQRHEPGEYRQRQRKDDYRVSEKEQRRSYEKDKADRYSRQYTSRDTKQYSRKQNYHYHQSSERNHQEKRSYQNKQRYDRNDREYRNYDRPGYNYQPRYNKNDSRYKEQSLQKQYNQNGKVSIQNRQRQQPLRKKYSPKKEMQVEDY